MAQLNLMELQSLRHLIGGNDLACEKLEMYSQQSVDPQVKAFFKKCSQDAAQSKQKLLSFLN